MINNLLNNFKRVTVTNKNSPIVLHQNDGNYTVGAMGATGYDLQYVNKSLNLFFTNNGYTFDKLKDELKDKLTGIPIQNIPDIIKSAVKDTELTYVQRLQLSHKLIQSGGEDPLKLKETITRCMEEKYHISKYQSLNSFFTNRDYTFDELKDELKGISTQEEINKIIQTVVFEDTTLTPAQLSQLSRKLIQFKGEDHFKLKENMIFNIKAISNIIKARYDFSKYDSVNRFIYKYDVSLFLIFVDPTNQEDRAIIEATLAEAKLTKDELIELSGKFSLNVGCDSEIMIKRESKIDEMMAIIAKQENSRYPEIEENARLFNDMLDFCCGCNNDTNMKDGINMEERFLSAIQSNVFPSIERIMSNALKIKSPSIENLAAIITTVEGLECDQKLKTSLMKGIDHYLATYKEDILKLCKNRFSILIRECLKSPQDSESSINDMIEFMQSVTKFPYVIIPMAEEVFDVELISQQLMQTISEEGPNNFGALQKLCERLTSPESKMEFAMPTFRFETALKNVKNSLDKQCRDFIQILATAAFDYSGMDDKIIQFLKYISSLEDSFYNEEAVREIFNDIFPKESMLIYKKYTPLISGVSMLGQNLKDFCDKLKGDERFNEAERKQVLLFMDKINNCKVSKRQEIINVDKTRATIFIEELSSTNLIKNTTDLEQQHALLLKIADLEQRYVLFFNAHDKLTSQIVQDILVGFSNKEDPKIQKILSQRNKLIHQHNQMLDNRFQGDLEAQKILQDVMDGEKATWHNEKEMGAESFALKLDLLLQNAEHLKNRIFKENSNARNVMQKIIDGVATYRLENLTLKTAYQSMAKV